MRVLLLKPVLSCSPNSKIILSFKDYIRVIILKYDYRTKKRPNEVLVATYRQTVSHLNCHDLYKEARRKISYFNSKLPTNMNC